MLGRKKNKKTLRDEKHHTIRPLLENNTLVNGCDSANYRNWSRIDGNLLKK